MLNINHSERYKSTIIVTLVVASLAGLYLGFLVLSDGDTVRSKYKTYSEVAADELFGRGWLPEFIPSSSFEIDVANNLDLNTSHGEFYFEPADTNGFTSHLAPYSGRKSPFVNYEKFVEKQKAKGYATYEYVEEGAVWVFFLSKERGHVRYDMWVERTGR